MKIAIASGKGGTGKTTISVNLASYISEQEEVILVDLDVEGPNSSLFIKAKPTHQEYKYKRIPKWEKNQCLLCGQCQTNCNFNAIIQLGEEIIVFPELCHSCFACSDLCPKSSLPMKAVKMGEINFFKSDNLDFVESRLDIGQEQAVPLIAQTKKQIDHDFKKHHLIIYDAPPGTSCPVIEATKDSDFVILVTEPTPFGLHDLKLAIETMRVLKKDFGVIINRNGIGNNDVHKYCLSEEIPIIANLPNSRKIAELYSSGKLIYKENKDLEQIFKHIKEFINTLKNSTKT
jgi:MinD superfamily P-loop ATPase